MPKLTLYYPEGSLSDKDLRDIFFAAGVRVADATSTDASPLSVDDVDYVPIPYSQAGRFCQRVAFEVETFGYPVRKAKLNKEAALGLRGELADIIDPYIKVERDKQLLWLKFQDPDGHHL